jgi:hypothetical protein
MIDSVIDALLQTPQTQRTVSARKQEASAALVM